MKYFIVLFLIALTFALSPKINSDVQRELSLNGGKADIFIEFKDKVNFATLSKENLDEMEEIKRGRLVFDSLRELAAWSQVRVKAFLLSRNIAFQSFYVDNLIWVQEISQENIEEISKFDEVSLISYNIKINLDELEKPISVSNSSETKAVEWNVEWVNAPKVWEMGHKGRGVVIGQSDTGTVITHPAIRTQYRGLASNNHNFNWFDGSTTGTSRVPIDQNGHGSHCMGTKVGHTPSDQVGVAPESTWISCRSLGPGASRATVVRCLQFLLAPFNLDGQGANPDLRPHVTSHSYRCDGCTLEASVNALNAAGVIVVVAIGNSGPRCSSTNEPGAFAASFGVGALGTRTDTIATFSSRGPVQGRVKPDVSAPGQNVRSCRNAADGYQNMSGTSMACPCVAGAVALLWSAVPRLSRNIAATKQLFQNTAKKQPSNECSSSGTPNNVYGHGTIDVHKAVTSALKIYGGSPKTTFDK